MNYRNVVDHKQSPNEQTLDKTYRACVNEGVFKLLITSQQLLPEKSGILQMTEEAHEERAVWKEWKVNRFDIGIYQRLLSVRCSFHGGELVMRKDCGCRKLDPYL